MTFDPQRQETDPSGLQNPLLPATPLRIVTMVLLFATAGVLEARNLTSLSTLANADIWWHLRTGLWILQNHALPHAGLFSQSPNSPWIATSWTYDLKLAIFYKLFGLAAIPIFSISFKVGLAIVTFLLAGGRRGNFWAALIVSAIAQYILAAAPATPRCGSILFFGVELLLLLESRRCASLRLLFWLPPLFLVWANLDPYFVYGLALLLLFLAAVLVENVLHSGAPHPPLAPNPDAVNLAPTNLAMIAAASAIATIITPYFYRPWRVFFSTVFSAANPYLPDYRAPGFRQPQDYLLLLFVMSAFLALGMRRSRDPFLIALLAASAALSFHSQRDLWMVVLAASAVLGQNINRHDSVILSAGIAGRSSAITESKGPYFRHIFVAAALAIFIVGMSAAILIPHGPEALLAKVSQNYPVAAADYIREHRLPQPLFNAFEWGGFLTWYLPKYPVAIDGRIDLYGDDFIVACSRVMSVEARYTDFPAMANAATIILPPSAVMAQALSTLPAYKVAYSDTVATVLIRNTDGSAAFSR